MLQSLKKWASGWVASILIGFLILSFAIWGVADVFTGYGAGNLATIGERTVTAQEFQRAYQNEINVISQQARQRITQEQARAVGLDRRVLTQLINAAAIEEHAGDLGLALSDAALLKGMQNDPQLQGSDGRFSKAALRSTLRQIGMSEGTFLTLRRRDELRDQITSALIDATVVPPQMIDNMHNWRNETRQIRHVTIDAEKLVKIDKPDEETLKTAYEDNKIRFQTPPMRHLAILLLSINDLKKKAEVPEADIKQSYEETKAEYDIQELRKIEQISFKDRASADKAKKALDGGKDFLEVAKEAGLSEEEVDLGLKEKTELVDTKIADAAFALKQDEISDVIEGQFTTVILRVTKIQPARLSTYEDVKPRVRDKLAERIAHDQLQKIYGEVDDGRAAGKPLNDIAEALGLIFYEIEATDRNNRTPSGSVALDRPDAGLLARAGFEGEIGLESEPVELTDGGYAWVDVLGITEAKQRPFEEAKEDVEKFWTQKQRDAEIAKLADELVSKLVAGEDFDKVADAAGGTPKKTLSITRSIVPDGLTEAAVTQAFVLPLNGAGSAATADGKSRTLLKVVSIEPATEATKEEREAIRKELAQQMQSNQIDAYITALRAEKGVSVDDRAFRRITGADTENQ